MTKAPVKKDAPEQANAPATTPPVTEPHEGITTGLPADEYQREQDKGGRDPVSEPVEPEKAEPVDIAPNEPYPTGGGKSYEGVPQNQEPGGGISGVDQK